MDQTPRDAQNDSNNVPLYDGDGETVQVQYRRCSVEPQQVGTYGHRGARVEQRRQPLGRSEELRQAQEERYQNSQYNNDRSRYGGDPYSRRAPYQADDEPPKKTKKRKNKKKKSVASRIGWGFVILLCLLCIGTMGLFVAPQLLGVQFATLPNYAFANGMVISLDADTYSQYRSLRQYMNSGTIYSGVTIDGVDVGGMTKDEATLAVSRVSATEGSSFQITVNVDGQSWSIDSSNVPMTRNIQEMVDKAYAYGRSNTTSIRGTGITPFQERINEVSALQANPVNLTTTITYDRDTIRTMTESIAASINCDPVNASVASFDFSTKTFTFNSDTSGAYVSATDIYDQVIACLDAGDNHATIDVEVEILLAETTKAELMNSFRKVSSYTTQTTKNANRNTNIRLSAEAINGITVQPGETFSFNEATGQRTEEKGYKAAAAISGGQSKDEIGGGVCQTSSTLFNAVARANLEIVYRSPHAWPSSYVEKGMDATVNWPNLDFKFRNDTDWPIFIVAWYENREVTVEIYGMSLGEGITIDLESEVTKTIQAPEGIKYVQNTDLPAGTSQKTVSARKGYEVNTYKVWYQNGKEISRELLCTSTYKAYQETVEYN
jgi:vancomycin resistance protein YoaR